MDSSLLCDEVWLSSPMSLDDCCDVESNLDSFYYTTKEDCEHAISTCLEKEQSCMPEPGYHEYLHSKNLLFARFRAIQWLIKSRSRLNLSLVTVFSAANYLDRFLSMNQCHEWKYWMVELLSVACLSVACKFNETSAPSLHEIQMEDLDHLFQPITIQRMELILLQALGWRLHSATSYSYVELLTMNIEFLKSNIQKNLVARITDLLLQAMLDCKLMEYPQSIAAVSALWCSLEELVPWKCDEHLAYIMRLFNHDWDDVVKCHNVMEGNSLTFGSSYHCPSSPDTVLPNQRIGVSDHHVDLSLFAQMRKLREG